jgi:hypothetical protein
MSALYSRVALPVFLLSTSLCILAVPWSPAPARADGGTLILREERDSLVVSLLAEPNPPRAGPVALEVLVQSRETGQPILSGDVRLRLRGPDAGAPLEVTARAESAANRLFRAARVELATPGPWQIEIQVAGPDGGETFRAQLEVAAPHGPVRRHWPYIAATLLGVALLALHQARSLSRPRAARRSSRQRSTT